MSNNTIKPSRLSIIITSVITAFFVFSGWAMTTTTAAPNDESEAHSERARMAGQSDAPTIWSHRGASKKAPEATEAAYRQALIDGADVLEGDIAQTKDGELVVIHDDSLKRTTDVEDKFPDRDSWDVKDFTLAEIKELDAGSWWDDAFAGEKILTLSEWFEFNDGRAGLAPELKNPDIYPGIVETFVDELEEWGYTSGELEADNGATQIWVQSFSSTALKEFHDLLPDVPVFALTPGYTYFNGSDEELEEVAEWADAVAGNPEASRASEVKRVQDFDLTVVSEVVDSPELVQAAANQNYDIVFTNTPDVAKNQILHNEDVNDNEDIMIDNVIYRYDEDESGQYLSLLNTTDKEIDISGFTVRNFANTLLSVSDEAVIEPGSRYFIYVSNGENDESSFYNGIEGDVFNIDKTDHIYAYDAHGKIVDIYSYVL